MQEPRNDRHASRKEELEFDRYRQHQRIDQCALDWCTAPRESHMGACEKHMAEFKDSGYSDFRLWVLDQLELHSKDAFVVYDILRRDDP